MDVCITYGNSIFRILQNIVNEYVSLIYPLLSAVNKAQVPIGLVGICRAVHDYEYIQIQFDYYGMIMIKIHL